MKLSGYAGIFAITAVLTGGTLQGQQNNADIKFIAETLVVQADGVYQTDPDVATLTFDVSAQDKELKPTYGRATQSLQKILALAERNGSRKATSPPAC
jgi:hypothetical protein